MGETLRRFWEWQVGGQVIGANLNLLTGREIVTIDAAPVLNRISWRWRNEIPLVLEDGRSARLILSSTWGFRVRCVLEVQGESVEPRVVPTRSKLQRILTAALLLFLGVYAVLTVSPWLIGGSELPPPKWTTKDLPPMPPKANNAWYAIESTPIPGRGDKSLLDENERIPSADLQAAKDALGQPDVVALLAHVPDVLARPELAVPPELGGTGVIQLSLWRYWLALSLSMRLELEPNHVAETLAKTLPMWIGCANTARNIIAYYGCALQAQRDLALMSQTLDYLPSTPADKGRTLLETTVKETPPLSTRYVLPAEYIQCYDLLQSLTAEHNLWVDKRATLRTLDQLFTPQSIAALCAKPRERPPLYEALYTYNYLGDAFAESVAGSSCLGFDRVNTVVRSVSDARNALLEKTLQVF